MQLPQKIRQHIEREYRGYEIFFHFVEKWEKLGRMRPSAVSLAFLHLLLLPNTFSAAEGAMEEVEKSEGEEGEVKNRFFRTFLFL